MVGFWFFGAVMATDGAGVAAWQSGLMGLAADGLGVSAILDGRVMG